MFSVSWIFFRCYTLIYHNNC
uniref:Uncharacterized protein n=1 Tax=Anguilla anguilla TaxID=7936 RepID=A0A0E9PQ29_ANGAN